MYKNALRWVARATATLWSVFWVFFIISSMSYAPPPLEIVFRFVIVMVFVALAAMLSWFNDGLAALFLVLEAFVLTILMAYLMLLPIDINQLGVLLAIGLPPLVSGSIFAYLYFSRH